MTDAGQPPSVAPEGKQFPKKIRLRRSADYRRVQGRGQKLRSGHLIVLYTRSQAAESRFGLTVSRKVGKAVTRNQVKRWLREIIRRHRSELVGRWDVVFIASPHASEADLQTLELEVVQALRRIGSGRER